MPRASAQAGCPQPKGPFPAVQAESQPGTPGLTGEGISSPDREGRQTCQLHQSGCPDQSLETTKDLMIFQNKIVVFVCFLAFKRRILWVTLVVLELDLLTRLASNSEFRLPMSPEC